MPFYATIDLQSVEELLGNSAFLHGLSIHSGKYILSLAIYVQTPDGDLPNLNSLKFDTCASRSSIMGLPQSDSYRQTFVLCKAIRLGNGKGRKGIGGKAISVGSAIIQITLQNLGKVIDVRFTLLKM